MKGYEKSKRNYKKYVSKINEEVAAIYGIPLGLTNNANKKISKTYDQIRAQMPDLINIPDEIDDVSEESKKEAEKILNQNKDFSKQITKFKSTPKATDFFDAAMLTPDYNGVIKEILDNIKSSIK